MSNTRLTEIGLKYRTDKAYDHGFTNIYDPYFQHYTNPTILEIGIYNGASLLTYNEYFNNQCRIIGVDNGEQLGFHTVNSNISIVIADQNHPVDLAAKVQGEYDIIIDDGSHFVEHQINCFEVLQSMVKKNGIYIIEDLHCCYHPFYNPNQVEHTITYLQNLKNNKPSHIESIEIFSDVNLDEATNLSHITSVIKFN